MKLAPIADRIAAAYRPKPTWDVQERWYLVRDYCDMKTGGDLDCLQLDMLTDMVVVRLNKVLTVTE